MCLRSCLSIGLVAMLLACDVGVSGLESVSLNPPAQGGAAGPLLLDASLSEEGGETFGDGPADAAGRLPTRGVANSAPTRGAAAEAGVTTGGNPAPDPADGAANSPGSIVDASVPVVDPIGCPDRAACPADEVCCARFEDGGYVPAFDDAGGVETTCRPSCTAGTTPLCVTNADCGDAGTCVNYSAVSTPHGFCLPPYFPTYPGGPAANH